jgi:putative mRNA 3-end processing factor
MDEYRARLRSDGAILLGGHVSCDGFAWGWDYRVQTHIHSDHMVGFDTSKANQTILMSPDTKELLLAIYNADLPYRSNVRAIAEEEPYEAEADLVELLPSNHMLGSVQVCVTCEDGYRVGYSSDFFWPVDRVIQVDELVVDSTYGDPAQIREYSQALVDAKLIDLVASCLAKGTPTALIGYNGRLQYALSLCREIIHVPVICSPKAYPVLQVYNTRGHPMPGVLRSDTEDAIALLKARVPVLAVVTLPERRHCPWLERFRKVALSAYTASRKDPITVYDSGDCCIALTDHADFAGTLEYVKSTGAAMVWTDPRSGNAQALAEAISSKLQVQSAVLPESRSLGWG